MTSLSPTLPPAPPGVYAQVMLESPLPATVRALLWEHGSTPGSPDASPTLASHPGFVAGRVLEYGTLRDVRWLVAQLGLGGLREALAAGGSRWLSPKTLDLWSLVLGAPLSLEEPCLRSRLSRRLFWGG